MNENKDGGRQTVPESEEFLKRVEEAAREGARQGARTGRGGGFRFYDLLRSLVLLALIAGFCFIGWRVMTMTSGLRELVEREMPVEGHDLVLENQGFLGYTAADFQDAILGDSQQKKSITVYETSIRDTVQLTDTGLARLKIFSKTQLLTYKGTASYSVDLGRLTRDDITLDEAGMTVHLRIPHAVLEPINIKEDEIEFGDVDRGLLAFGKMKMTPEDTAKVQTEARNKMEERLEEEKTAEQADKFAVMTVWDIYQPIIDAVTTGYSLEVEFKD